MGTAQILADPSLRRAVASDRRVKILGESAWGEQDWVILKVRSRLLARDCRGVQDCILDGGRVRFKDWLLEY